MPPLPRLTSLPADAIVALRETLRHLDLPMLDALARRERGNAIGRIARAVALALRLELDAAALILEPLGLWEDVLSVDPSKIQALIESRPLPPDVEDAVLASREEVRTQHALWLKEPSRSRR